MKVWLVRTSIINIQIFYFSYKYRHAVFQTKKEEVIKEKELNNIEIGNDIYNKNNFSNSLDGQSKHIHK